jgi:hypothetical protein
LWARSGAGFGVSNYDLGPDSSVDCGLGGIPEWIVEKLRCYKNLQQLPATIKAIFLSNESDLG